MVLGAFRSRKSRKAFSQVSASSNCRAWPGHHGSPSESATSAGQVMFPALPASVPVVLRAGPGADDSRHLQPTSLESSL